jgi:hypothetical protein
MRRVERDAAGASDSNGSCLRNRQLVVTSGFCAAHRKIAQFVIKQWFTAACDARAQDRKAEAISMAKCRVLGAAGVARQLLEEIRPTPGAGLVNDDDAQRVLRRLSTSAASSVPPPAGHPKHREPFRGRAGKRPSDACVKD